MLGTTLLRFSRFFFTVVLFVAAAPAPAEIYVCAGDSVSVFADDAGAGSQPVRTITGPTSGIAECYAIALDNLHGELWVTTQTTVRVFPARATGDIPPLRTIQGDKTTLATVVGLFVDRVNDELYAVNYGGAILVFSRSADGNVAPLRPFASEVNPFGLVVDARAGEVFVTTGSGSVLTYDRNGAALRTIAGGSTGLTQTTGLALRQDGILLVGNQYHSATTPDAIFGFPRTQNGDASSIIYINFAAPLQTVMWGVATSRAFECGEGQTTSYCVFRTGFE
jgi:hypothetical protein